MDEKKVPGSIPGAIAVGGCIAVVMQVVMMVLGAVLPVAELVPALTLVILGLIGAALVLGGVYGKLTEVGGFGAQIMFCGLVDAVAGIYAGATLESGDPKQGTNAAMKFALAILGTISVVGVVLGFALASAGNAGVVASAIDATANPGPISLLYAFLMGATISVVGQALLMFTPLPLPAVILIEGACGMLLAVLGVFGMLEAVCGAGLVCTVVDAGGGMVAGGALLAVAGTPVRIVIIALVMVIVVLLGLFSGKQLVKRAKAGQR